MGHHNLVFTGDAHADSGIWGTPTSAANFCEEDYAVTTYIAEFINTITNLAYIYCAVRYCRKTQPGAAWYTKLDLMSYALIGVGICSTAFHGTMRQIPQYFDDLSMFALAGALLQPLYSVNQKAFTRFIVSAVLVHIILGVSVVYVRSGDIRIHTVAFLTMVTFMWPRTLYLIKRMGRPVEEQRRMMKIFWRAFWNLVIGYALWNVDLEFCLNLRAVRETIGMPWSWVLELHGWWHILTAVGASYFVKLVRMCTGDEPILKKQHKS
ncbi:dihydroceramidase [Plectosphaerella plurivora]|uniref:Dihydroceramidase n=1 Tax=Plectosphaerella plurivora TaxID=936078 RepID=A0A9P8V112_9PEZI|nr:dihydroceramidase [Plectosphaerella plurivora]